MYRTLQYDDEVFYPLLYIAAKSSVLHPAALRTTSYTHHQDSALASGHVRASEVPAEHQCHAGANGRGKPYHLVDFDKTPKLAKEGKLLKPKDEKQGSNNGNSNGMHPTSTFPTVETAWQRAFPPIRFQSPTTSIVKKPICGKEGRPGEALSDIATSLVRRVAQLYGQPVLIPSTPDQGVALGTPPTAAGGSLAPSASLSQNSTPNHSPIVPSSSSTGAVPEDHRASPQPPPPAPPSMYTLIATHYISPLI
ncbi:hypothetical protein EMCRGX_G015156 [Ephydatia muelleri]